MDGVTWGIIGLTVAVLQIVLWSGMRRAWKLGVRSGWIAGQYPDLASPDTRREIEQMHQECELRRQRGK